jgi:hypothetical protein
LRWRIISRTGREGVLGYLLGVVEGRREEEGEEGEGGFCLEVVVLGEMR